MAHAVPGGTAWGAGLLMPALALLMSMRRSVALSPGLARTLPAGRSWRGALVAGASLVAVLNTVLLAAALVSLGTLVPAAVAGAVGMNLSALWGATRLVAAPAPDHGTGLVMTEAGALPVGAALTALRGWDVVMAAALVASVA